MRLAREAYRLSLRSAIVICGDRALADEMAQDVVVEVLSGMTNLRRPESFRAWVHTITTRSAKRGLWRRSVRRVREQPLDESFDVGSGRGGEADRLALSDALRTALARLPHKQRVAIALRYVHDLSDAEIAAALRCKEGTVHSHLSRARAALAKAPELRDEKRERGDVDGYRPATEA